MTNKIAQIQTTMMASAEFQNVYPSSLSLQAYITLAFNNVLLRNPTPTELNQNQALSRNQIMTNLIASAEFNNRIFAPAYGNLMYLAILRRSASDPNGLAFWTGVLANPNLLQTVIQNFSTSQEYFNRFQ